MNFIRYIAWAWIIIVGGLMITPGGVECIRCGALGTRILGVISILIGIAGLVSERRRPAEATPVAGELETSDDTPGPVPANAFTISDYRRGAEEVQAAAASDAGAGGGGVVPPRGTIPPRKGGAR